MKINLEPSNQIAVSLGYKASKRKESRDVNPYKDYACPEFYYWDCGWMIGVSHEYFINSFQAR